MTRQIARHVGITVLFYLLTFGGFVDGFKPISPSIMRGQDMTHQRQHSWKSQLYPTRTTNASASVGVTLFAGGAATPPENSKKKTGKRIMLVWVHAVTIFMIVNYARKTIWPAILLDIPLKVWNLIHALSGMAFAGGIVTTTLLEWQLPSIAHAEMKSNNNNTSESSSILLLKWLWQVESRLVLPAVTGSLISGVAQAFHMYPSLKLAPRHVKSAMHMMLLFGMWWAWTDRRSQAALLQKDGFDESKVVQRRFANLVSCAFLVALYGIMILKPGLGSYV